MDSTAPEPQRWSPQDTEEHPRGLDRLYPRDAFRSVSEMERSELVALAGRMDLTVDPEWGTDRLRRFIGETLTE